MLIITYYFPPREAVASLRLKGLAKYLPEYGWEPVIITPELPGKPDPQFKVVQTPYPGDVSALLKKRLGLKEEIGFQEQIGIPRSIRESKKSFTNGLINLVKAIVVYPDEQREWYPFAVEAGRDLLKTNNFRAMISSSGPVTCHLVANTLAKEFSIPWIADLRDLWTQNHHYQYPFVRKILERKLELTTLSLANALVTVSVPLALQLAELHKGKQVFAIPNGFDPDDVGAAPLTSEFSITYTGTLYQGRRDPALLFQAISELIAAGEIDPSNIRIRFYGDMPWWLEEEVAFYNLGNMVSLNPKVPRDLSLVKQRESQILLLLNWDDPREQGVYTGKLFEYLAARRPILALGRMGGVVAQLLEETGVGICVGTLKNLKGVLRSWYEEYKLMGRVGYRGNWEIVEKYSHREMARRFAAVLDSL